MEIFPETLKKLWNLWEIRSLFLLSLSLQIILVVFGSRRKINNSHSWIGILLNVIVWCAYISADWVATVALSVMASNEADCEHASSKATDSLQAFWAPFLLLHLGGPDTITAYSLEDNELCNVLTLLSIPVFITGIVKYGERTWVLWSSSSERFKDSLGSFKDSSGSSSNPDPCLDFFNKQSYSDCLMLKEGIKGEDHNLVQAYYSYNRLLYLFANQIINESRYYNYEIIAGKSAEDAFKLVAIELGLIYDVLYTKAAIVYSLIGISLRCISFVSSVSALVLFSIIIDMQSYSLIDIMVTYLLLVGAVLLEIYAFMVLSSSDWTRLWLIKFKVAKHRQISETLVDKFWKFSSCLHSCSTSKKRWSESMGQYNLMNYVRKERRHAYPVLEKFSYTSKLLENYRHLTWENVDIGLQERIFCYLKKIARELHNTEVYSYSFSQIRDKRLSNKGEYALKQYYRFADQLLGNEFDKRIIIWHIVTYESYEEDLHHVHGDANKLDQDCKISKWLSDYMLYLLYLCPSMLPKRNGEIWDTYGSLLSKTLGKNSDFKDSENSGKIRWDVISEVWLEMLAYAAQDCDWKEHAQHLRKG
ncbi:hypothetical protein EZV62_003416 [Acer yangbiense]|uniref:DUF4220 domain-containing protein n=1 Tax=Acer yangbiense TaxID=1000413 RepID=A0A5C7IH59_9ROSI|nr:hypothetical protein EZV62_003416 [Acer yangbiense]